MKVLSDNAVTKSDLTKIDIKQTEQIEKLRIWLAASFAFNVVLTLTLYFL